MEDLKAQELKTNCDEGVSHCCTDNRTNRASYCGMTIVLGPPLWSSGQSSWLQIRRPGFDSRHYQKKK
jgi:hypothetical protein